MNNNINIAIDGPAAAGKSTISRSVAQTLGYIYIDTGAMYRAVTLFYLEHGEEYTLSNLNELNISFKNEDDTQKVYLNAVDVTAAIRSAEVTQNVSEVSSHEAVRNYLARMQQHLAKDKGVVMDGRDIGTIVLPDAELKVFMHASPKIRAERRLLEEEARGNSVDIETLTEQIKRRDEIDSTRKISPLIRADDARLLDTGHMSAAEVKAHIITLAKQTMKGE